ncbi:TonB-dependent receptor [Niabella sp.]|uniref:TonB-dependent receptor n=1 Tax=Niabella sp. TaxID=1962976 RepID=UPI002625172B|nr:TonB-dependent receptor [Niabella sp.]
MTSRQVLFLSIFVALTAFIGSGRLYGQVNTAAVSGSVYNGQGAPMLGVTVSLAYTATGSQTTTQTNKNGIFYIPNLNPGGPYTISISHVGFKPIEADGLSLTLGNNTLNFKMETENGTLSNVVVTGNRKGGLKTGAGLQISQNQMKSLPSISRSLQDLTRLTPQSNNNSFMGTNFRYNNVTLDGAINNDAIGFSPSLGGQTNSSGQPGSSTRTNPVSMDAIQDVQVYLAPYDVKIGNFLGGSVNAVTRSGTNTFHGSVYGFGRNASLIGKNNAGDGTALPSSFHEYQTGVRLGFPIIKNKLFFFTNEEITRRKDPVILAAGSPDMGVITLQQAQQISRHMDSAYGVNAGSYDNYTIYSNSNKFFNRVDWHISDKHQLSVRNNTIRSEATNLERDQQNFRFGGIDFKQTNNQSSTVAELKSRFSNELSNNLVLGYSNIHDYRTPSSNPALPQIQIKNNGGTIFLGTDREASIFNMKQKTFEFTDNITLLKGRNTFTFGTHNEFYSINYGFVNSWNGRVEYDNINNFLNNLPTRVRTNYSYANNTRDYLWSNPPAEFKIGMYSLYGQDEIRATEKLKVTLGLRFDMASMPNKQPLSPKTSSMPEDPFYGSTYTYTKPKDIKNDFLGQVQVSPRFGFNYDVNGDQRFIIRGGSGLFTSRIPFAWLGYAYYNNGVTFGSADFNKVSPVPGSDPIRDAISGNNGEAAYAAKQGNNITDANDPKAQTQIDLIDNNFKMPKAWRSSLALEYTTPDQWKFSVEGIYTKVIHDLKFQQVNLKDSAYYGAYDVNQQQPFWGNKKLSSNVTSMYLLSNTNQGYRYSITAQINKSFPFGINAMVAYTYGVAKDLTNGIRNSMESNWQLNQALNPNNPSLAYSNFDTRHRIVSTLNYHLNWGKDNAFVSNFTFFFSAASGAPFSYGAIQNINGIGQQVGLMYIPNKGETAKFITTDLKDSKGNITQTAAQQVAAFDAFIDGDKYLSTRRGKFTERNAGRTPWNNQLDFRFAQDFNLNTGGKTVHTITLTYDIVNLTNLLNKEWGWQYFSPNTFNSTADIGVVNFKAPAAAAANYSNYNWVQPTTGLYSKDFFASRWQMQLGLRYSF